MLKVFPFRHFLSLPIFFCCMCFLSLSFHVAFVYISLRSIVDVDDVTPLPGRRTTERIGQYLPPMELALLCRSSGPSEGGTSTSSALRFKAGKQEKKDRQTVKRLKNKHPGKKGSGAVIYLAYLSMLLFVCDFFLVCLHELASLGHN